MNEHLVELESRLTFQDSTIQQLNEVITRQQRQIDQMVNELEFIKRQLRTLSPPSVVRPEEETPPPHY